MTAYPHEPPGLTPGPPTGAEARRESPPPPSPNVRLVEGVDAELPYLRVGRPHTAFLALREAVIKGAGFDFLARAELMRPRDYVSPRPGVGERSRHKCGDAFCYDREDRRAVIVREEEEGADGLTFWRTWLRCEPQDGRRGQSVKLLHARGRASGYFFDFTQAAERCGFERVPDRAGDAPPALLREAAHYQLDEGYTFDEALRFLYDRRLAGEMRPERASPRDRALGLNDRGRHVLDLQRQLAAAEYLARGADAAGVFDEETRAAVERLQREYGLPGDGLADPETRRRLVELVIRAVQCRA